MQILSNTLAMIAVGSLLVQSPVKAEPVVPSRDDVATAMLDSVRTTCPDEVVRYSYYFENAIPDQLERPSGRINIAHLEAQDAWPYSPEQMQIVVYTIAQAAQAGALISYQSELRNSVEMQEPLDISIKEHALAATDFAKCSLPVGVRFSQSEEPAIAELAHAVTAAVICKRWHEFSVQILMLDSAELTSESLEQAIGEIGAATLLQCDAY